MRMVEREWLRDWLSLGVTPTLKNWVRAGMILFWLGAAGAPQCFEGVSGEGSSVALAVAFAEDRRSVVGGIEADAEQVSLGAERGVSLERSIYFGEVAGHAGAEFGEVAAGVDEGEEQPTVP